MGFLAGVEGFEPSNGGFRVLCLTTWLHPNIFYINQRNACPAKLYAKQELQPSIHILPYYITIKPSNIQVPI